MTGLTYEFEPDSKELLQALKANGNFSGRTSDAQHEALKIVANAVLECAQDWHNMGFSPYTGHSAYVVLSYVHSSIIFPDVEIYRGQREASK